MTAPVIHPAPSNSPDSGLARRAGTASFVVGALVMGLKFWCYELTNSQIVLSDALESIVNVAAAGFTFIVLYYAALPPDEEHPYGHGKTEFFSAAFEGGLVAFAAALIVIDSAHALWSGHAVNRIDLGLVALAVAAAINLILGAALLKVGARTHSIAVQASGHHVLSDVWTTLAAVIGLLLVQVTGFTWIDPLMGLGAGIYLSWIGARILRGSLGGLIDEKNRDVLINLADAFNEVRVPGIIGVHGARIMRAGNYHYIDAHVIVAEFWNVRESHDRVNTFERAAIDKYKYSGEIHFHIDPCRKNYCKKCDLADCPIRIADFSRRISHTLEEVTARSSTRD